MNLCCRCCAKRPQSVVLFDDAGRRMVHTDLKDVGETHYPVDLFERAVHGCRFAVMTNAAFSRPRLSQIKAAGASIATDLQTASESSCAYDADFLQAADVIFLSHDKLTVKPGTFVSTLWERTGARVVVVGMGASGALLCLRGGESRRVFRRSRFDRS
jgi:acarbose 7IV-phosphotransferase